MLGAPASRRLLREALLLQGRPAHGAPAHRSRLRLQRAGGTPALPAFALRAELQVPLGSPSARGIGRLARRVLKLDADPLPPEAGVPIGSYLSQWAGSLYLDGLDHFVMRELEIPAYSRYMDDFILFANDPHQLAAARIIIAQWLRAERRLELNPKRRTVVPTAQPSVYLGYRVSRAGIVPSHKMKKRMKKRIRALRGDPCKLARSLRSYRSLFTFG